ncbi:uncharacterized protein LOC112513468 [Cynara cardunculus var. scolymus]|uniref:Uncharacterized protein n=1 Tax=Cynara cardunculus var. scolymus TaxID=59895 RepID=A0A124SFB9_CYNCS|nr:uncharacterized protein LOC112513468 [Cynara cardunculus var. scolymus]KVI02686.1 Protein of unknown function DUF1685 [Cynara cardunculus var. scolymus]
MPPPHPLAAAPPPPPPSPLYKHKSWSPDILRDEEWLKRKDKHYQRYRRRNKSVTDEDIDELKACIELGFGFDESNDRLSSTLPALGLYYTVNKQYHDTISKSSSMSSSSSSSVSSYSSSVSESDLFSPSENPRAAVFSRGDDPQTMKTRLRQWAQVVACSLRQSSSSSSSSSSS